MGYRYGSGLILGGSYPTMSPEVRAQFKPEQVSTFDAATRALANYAEQIPKFKETCQILQAQIREVGTTLTEARRRKGKADFVPPTEACARFLEDFKSLKGRVAEMRQAKYEAYGAAEYNDVKPFSPRTLEDLEKTPQGREAMALQRTAYKICPHLLRNAQAIHALYDEANAKLGRLTTLVMQVYQCAYPTAPCPPPSGWVWSTWTIDQVPESVPVVSA